MKKRLSILSIGPGDPSLLNQATLDQLYAADPLILRTDQHPLVSWLDEKKIAFTSLDDLYDTSDDFDSLCDRIAEAVWQCFDKAKHPVYAVPDPLTDRSVDSIFACCPENAAEIIVIPGFSYADFYLSRCRSLLNAGHFHVISAAEMLYSGWNPAEAALVTEIDHPQLAGNLKVFLSSLLDDETEVFLLQATGNPHKIPLFELDRQQKYDHMTALYIPASDYLQRTRYTMRDLLMIMDRLRAQDGCPWDRSQTHASLQPFLVEEAWECVDAINRQDYDHLSEELGDLLFQIVFHASIGKSFDEFTMNDVISHICAKMIRRHPHVFHESETETNVNDIAVSWEKIKQNETGHHTILSGLDDVAVSLPSLKYASKSLKKLRRSDAFIRNDQQIISDISAETAQIDPDSPHTIQKSMEHILIFCCELCLNHNIDPELILHHAVDSFKTRLKTAEKMMKNDGKTIEHLTFEELGVYLNHVEGEIE